MEKETDPNPDSNRLASYLPVAQGNGSFSWVDPSSMMRLVLQHVNRQ